MPLELTISALSKTYPNGVKALSNVSLTIPTGMFGLLGPNGAGKSTLTRTLATLQEADTGSKADALGKEDDAPLADWIDIGVLDADNQLLYLEKRKIDREQSAFTIVVDRKPGRAGIDLQQAHRSAPEGQYGRG